MFFNEKRKIGNFNDQLKEVREQLLLLETNTYLNEQILQHAPEQLKIIKNLADFSSILNNPLLSIMDKIKFKNSEYVNAFKELSEIKSEEYVVFKEYIEIIEKTIDNLKKMQAIKRKETKFCEKYKEMEF